MSANATGGGRDDPEELAAVAAALTELGSRAEDDEFLAYASKAPATADDAHTETRDHRAAALLHAVESIVFQDAGSAEFQDAGSTEDASDSDGASSRRGSASSRPEEDWEPSSKGLASDKGNKPLKTTPTFLKALLHIVETEDTELISYHDGNVVVPDPRALGKQVLTKYFRHDKFASFQRQLHYFGWKKIAGKGNEQPCVFSNVALKKFPAEAMVYLKRRTTGPNGAAVLRLPRNFRPSDVPRLGMPDPGKPKRSSPDLSPALRPRVTRSRARNDSMDVAEVEAEAGTAAAEKPEAAKLEAAALEAAQLAAERKALQEQRRATAKRQMAAAMVSPVSFKTDRALRDKGNINEQYTA